MFISAVVTIPTEISAMDEGLSAAEAAMANMSISTSQYHLPPQPDSNSLNLPFEIRTMIYKCLFSGADLVIDRINSGALISNYHPKILRTSKQIRREAYKYLPQALTLKLAIPQLPNLIHKMSGHFLNHIQDLTLFDMVLGPDINVPLLPALKRLEVQTIEWRIPKEAFVSRRQQDVFIVPDHVAHPLMLREALAIVKERGIRGFDFIVQFRFWATYRCPANQQLRRAEKVC